MSSISSEVTITHTRPEYFSGITELSQAVYPSNIPWTERQLDSHLKIFPEGQFVALDQSTQKVVGMASSLVILWEDYEIKEGWRDFTDNGMFTNHDPAHGRTLYGAEVMVHPDMQGHGIGKKIYQIRRKLAQNLNLLRIRAGARLRGYHGYAKSLSPEEYVIKVVQGELGDPTLSFQIRQGFHIIAVVPGYLQNDPESLGYAAVIEWLNPKVATPDDFAKIPRRFQASPQR